MKVKQSLSPSVLRKLEQNDLLEAEREYLFEFVRIIGEILEECDGVPQRDLLYRRLVDGLLENSRLRSFFRQPAAELDALKRISFNLTASLDLSVVLKGVVREALRLVKNAANVNIFLYLDGRLTFGAALNSKGDNDRPFAEPRSEGITYTVARQKEMILVEDVRTHPLFRDAPPDWQGSIVGLPLMVGQRVVGVMNLSRTVRGPFSPSEIRLLTLLADQAAIAIVNARLHEVVSHQARQDPLTGLPNRRGLDERLEAEIVQAARMGGVFSVMMLDMDGFKQVNDTWGHEAGDEILRQVASALLGWVRSSDFLARYGGDEMTLLLPGTDLPQAQVVARKIQEHMQTLPLSLPQGKTVTLALSGGIALYPRHGETAAALLRAADEALYRAKRAGRGCFIVAADEK